MGVLNRAEALNRGNKVFLKTETSQKLQYDVSPEGVLWGSQTNIKIMFLKTKSIHEPSLDRSSLKNNSFDITLDLGTAFLTRLGIFQKRK